MTKNNQKIEMLIENLTDEEANILIEKICKTAKKHKVDITCVKIKKIGEINNENR